MQAPPTNSERIEAVETFLQQLVLMLEVEPEITRENFSVWMQLCSASARAHGLETRRQTFVLDQLRERVLGTSIDVQRPAAGAWLS